MIGKIRWSCTSFVPRKTTYHPKALIYYPTSNKKKLLLFA